MENQIDNQQQKNNGKTTIGIILLGLGVLLLLSQFNFFTYSVWAITWPVALIGYGIYTGIKHNFKKTMWIIYTMVGVIFLLPNIIPATIGMLWPLVIMAVGVTYILRRDQHWNGNNWEKRNNSQFHSTDNNI